MAFIGSCELGNIELAKKLYDIDKSSSDKTRDVIAFTAAATNNHVHVMKWLLKISDGLINEAKQDTLFKKICYQGAMDAAKFLVTYRENVGCNAAFILACEKGNIDIAQWLHTHHETNHDMNVAMMRACNHGSYHIVCWLFSITTYHVNMINECLKHCCKYGYLDIAKLLISKGGDVEVVKKMFNVVCCGMYLNFLLWLIELGSSEDLMTDNSFKFVCNKCSDEMLVWIAETNPKIIVRNLMFIDGKRMYNMFTSPNTCAILSAIILRENKVTIIENYDVNDICFFATCRYDRQDLLENIIHFFPSAKYSVDDYGKIIDYRIERPVKNARNI